MKRWHARCGLWFPAIGILPVLARECALSSSRRQNLLPLANLPLTALLHWLAPGVLSPLSSGVSLTRWQALARWLPHYLLFVLSYLGYGLLLDRLLRRKKRR
ncbi:MULTISPECIES: hypothetical protein [Eubacteriales]|uniref:Uncharacterized protein n=1 Tax=Bittarella massiliensis (ex Durand et al. 2017) TaxID=1720313 RepID=A0AAQ1RWV3_9FIRM|nr:MULTISPECIES: hypothetical protein [Eubacteriales]MZL69397.1 hypothetical protein [Bittarella massiliensis (ex Durand et al. 2017)]MZL79061.1 hypothetical protein [Bittarella massiliensis (ex Durand et al. 2017)]SHG46130.1 hypothetical protein SAMN05444424_2460 [Bittarella massiliensis (ex Durand et al. 2017)]